MDVFDEEENQIHWLNWYGSLGNNDYNNQVIEALFEIKAKGWRMKNFFWSHTIPYGDEEIAFVHIDTNYLAYGDNGEPGNKWMEKHFEHY